MRTWKGMRENTSPRWSYLWSSLYHSKEAGGTAIASQRKMAVLPKWAGMFFMSVIMGGSGGKRPTQTDGRENKAISIWLCKREVQSGRPRSPVEYPREKTKLGFMNSGIIMHGRIYMYINNTSSCYKSGGPVWVEILAPGCFATLGGSTYSWL